VNRRSRILGFGSAAGLVLAGIGCAVLFSGGLGQNLAFALVALGFVAATALVFYEVGLTEDRQREREAQQRARESAERERAAPPGHPPERSTGIRLDRARGRPRRLR
jgi:hypothetical protein